MRSAGDIRSAASRAHEASSSPMTSNISASAVSLGSETMTPRRGRISTRPVA